MSFLTFLCLLIFYSLYLLAGGFIFKSLENQNDCQQKEEMLHEEQEIRQEILILMGKVFFLVAER
jgi:hypothetical protein